MKKLIVQYPWKQLRPGQGFFVPCLDTTNTMEEGLKAAISLRMFNAKAKAGIIAGKLGVLFYRPA